MGMMTVPIVTTRSKGSSSLSCTMRPASAPPFSSWEEPGRMSSFSFSPASNAVAMSKFWSRMFCMRKQKAALYSSPMRTRRDRTLPLVVRYLPRCCEANIHTKMCGRCKPWSTYVRKWWFVMFAQLLQKRRHKGQKHNSQSMCPSCIPLFCPVSTESGCSPQALYVAAWGMTWV